MGLVRIASLLFSPVKTKASSAASVTVWVKHLFGSEHEYPSYAFTINAFVSVKEIQLLSDILNKTALQESAEHAAWQAASSALIPSSLLPVGPASDALFQQKPFVVYATNFGDVFSVSVITL